MTWAWIGDQKILANSLMIVHTSHYRGECSWCSSRWIGDCHTSHLFLIAKFELHSNDQTNGQLEEHKEKLNQIWDLVPKKNVNRFRKVLPFSDLEVQGWQLVTNKLSRTIRAKSYILNWLFYLNNFDELRKQLIKWSCEGAKTRSFHRLWVCSKLRASK